MNRLLPDLIEMCAPVAEEVAKLAILAGAMICLGLLLVGFAR